MPISSAATMPRSARSTAVTRRAYPPSGPFVFAPWLGRGAVTLGLAVMLVACGQPIATQPAQALVAPTATATIASTATVAPTATTTATVAPTAGDHPDRDDSRCPVTITPTRRDHRAVHDQRRHRPRRGRHLPVNRAEHLQGR